MLAPEEIRPLSRAEYDRLVDLDFFEDERVELLRGVLVRMSPQGAAHANAPAKLMKRLILALGDRAEVRAHSPLSLGEWSEPEPDIAVVAPGDYSKCHPTTALLVVEAADSSLRKDRRIKADLYAEHEIPEYWIVNLVEGVVEVHTLPASGRYTSITTHGADRRVSLVAFPDVGVDAGELFA
ncbi:MAG TPA: Uma2 family endonuclease [Polyangiaceae bacterium]